MGRKEKEEGKREEGRRTGGRKKKEGTGRKEEEGRTRRERKKAVSDQMFAEQHAKCSLLT